MKIPFNRPFFSGKELEYIEKACKSHLLAGDNYFTKKCHAWFEENIHCQKALLTHSGTAALEMAAILIDITKGDEIIMPSYTFPSTANAFILRGGVPVFIDIREDSLNIDENKIEAAISEKTKAIVLVHYAGVACEMQKICAIAEKYNLYVIEDAAQAISSYYHDQPLGCIGDLGIISFHETKNVTSGEGGVLLINNAKLISRAEIIREKGTNRSQFFRGEIDKYSWVDIGSSYLPSDLIAAYLYAQLEKIEEINRYRLELWEAYHQAFEPYEKEGIVRRPYVPTHVRHNAHIYYLLLKNNRRDEFIALLKESGVHAIFHYIPLHNSIAGKKYGRQGSMMKITNEVSANLVRLPMWVGLKEHQQSVISVCCKALNKIFEFSNIFG